MRFFLSIFVVLILSVSGIAKAQERFSSMIEDLPLPALLIEDADNSVLFDKPSGRFIELQAYTQAMSMAEIYRFYERSLPALGWQKIDAENYYRDAERLKIHIEQKDKTNRVIFTLTPDKI